MGTKEYLNGGHFGIRCIGELKERQGQGLRERRFKIEFALS